MMPAPTVYCVPTEKTSPKWCAAFAAGSGGQVVDDGQLRAGPAAFWGSPKLWDTISSARRDGRRWYYGDHGYFGKGRFYRVTNGRLQHDGVSDEAIAMRGPDRFKDFGIPVKPWRKNGRHVLVCPPGDVFAGLMGFSAQAWTKRTLEILRAHTGRPIVVRYKGADNAARPLAADLDGCWALVTYMSNTAVEAILAGIPVFTSGLCAATAMSRPSLQDIERPSYPAGREIWARVLAANQWTLAEIAAGDCWRAIN